MKQLTLTLGHLYGSLMNVYGDNGNILALEKRSAWRGIKLIVKEVSIGDKIKPNQFDLFFFGGGQDQSQQIIGKDLTSSLKGQTLIDEIKRGVPLLAVCGGYQLLGEYYRPQNGPKIGGLGLLPVFTNASLERMIGNLVISSQFGDLVGFENHSGKTYLKKSAIPLGTVQTGFGNNGEDQTEGCIYENAIGCYMHGSLLPKNPKLADWLLSKALEVKYAESIALEPLDDSIENQAHDAAIQKFKLTKN